MDRRDFAPIVWAGLLGVDRDGPDILRPTTETAMGRTGTKKRAVTKQPARVRTLHPAGKHGVNIDKAKYDAMRRALLKVVPGTASGVAFKDLTRLVKPHLDPDVFGPGVSIPWYVVSVKQDLEARGLLEQVPGAKPQQLRRTKTAGR